MKRLIIIAIIFLAGCAGTTRWVHVDPTKNNQIQFRQDFGECDYQTNMRINTTGNRWNNFRYNEWMTECLHYKGWDCY